MVTKTPPAKKVKSAAISASKETPSNGNASSVKKVQKATTTEVSEIDPRTYVSKSKLIESLQVLRTLEEKFDAAKSEKKPLFEADSKFIRVQVELKKIPANFSTFIHSVSLPYHWRHAVDYETCLIVPDVNKEALSDRDLDLEQTKGRVFDILEAASATELIKEILPVRQLRNEFRPKPLRNKLGAEYGAFLCDRKLFRNKHSFLARFLGKAFWIDQRKVPIPVDLTVPASELRPQIEAALNQTQIYVSGKGASLCVTIGSLEQDSKKLLANLEAVLLKFHEIFPGNVRSLSLKTDRSMAVTFFMDLGSSNDVQLLKDPNIVAAFKDRFVEDEFDFLTNSSVRVYKDGQIKIISNKRKTPEDGEEKDQEDEVVEVAQPGELKFVKAINRSFQRGDQDWIRRKVSHMKKAQKVLRSKRLPGTKGFGKRFFKSSKGKKPRTAATTSKKN